MQVTDVNLYVFYEVIIFSDVSMHTYACTCFWYSKQFSTCLLKWQLK